MSKLTPPAPQHLKRRFEFFKAHPEWPGAKYELERIERIKAYKGIGPDWKPLPKDKRKKAVDGAEFYKQLKQQEATKTASKPAKKRENPLKSLMRIFNRGK